MPSSLERLADLPGLAMAYGQRVFPADKNGFTDVGGVKQGITAQRVSQAHGHSKLSCNLRGFVSPIADGDMMRIREAAALIMHEEAAHGR